MTKEEIQKIIVEKLNEYKFELPKDEYELVAEELAEMIVKNCSKFDVEGQRKQLKKAEEKGYARGWQEGAEYGYNAAHDGR